MSLNEREDQMLQYSVSFMISGPIRLELYMYQCCLGDCFIFSVDLLKPRIGSQIHGKFYLYVYVCIIQLFQS